MAKAWQMYETFRSIAAEALGAKPVEDEGNVVGSWQELASAFAEIGGAVGG